MGIVMRSLVKARNRLEIRLDAQDRPTLLWRGTSYRTVLGAAESQGTVSIVESVSPAGSGPPRHVHEIADESFVILTGECLFWVGGAEFTRGPGETAFIPRGVEHTFRVLGEVECRHYTILSPGGFEAFFVEMAQGQFRIPEDMPQVLAVASRHNLRFTGPPLAE